MRDTGYELRDARYGMRVSGYEMRALNLGSRITDHVSRIPYLESRLSRSPSTNSDQDQLTVEKWISYICSTRLIHDVHRILGTRILGFAPGTAMATVSPQSEMGIFKVG